MKYTSEFTAAEIDSKLKEISAIKQNLIEVEEYLTNLQTAVENKVEKVEGKELSSNDFTDEYKTKVDGLENYDDTAIKSDIEELQTGKVDKETGKSLSTNDYTTAEKEKLAGIEAGANKIVVDTSLSSTSTNPVQNKAVNTALGTKANSADVYDKTTSDSRFLGINGTAVKAVADGTGANIADNFKSVKSDIAVNKTTLGIQCKNLLNENAYISSITLINRGTITKSGNSITLTATSDDCYTLPFNVAGGAYEIPVLPNTDYILSWDSDNTNYGVVYTFMNGLATTGNLKSINNHDAKQLRFKTNYNTTFITVRFGVTYTGDSITYSNIMLRYADIQDDTYEPYQPSLQEQIDALTTRISALEGT